MVTEADWSSWKPSDLAPYVATVVELFGAQRLMLGSDWPVSTLAASYSKVLGAEVQILSDLVGADLEWALWRRAAGTYGLTV
jgi:L-fuconolactonase